MITDSAAHRITDVETLGKVYGVPAGAAVDKKVNYLLLRVSGSDQRNTLILSRDTLKDSHPEGLFARF